MRIFERIEDDDYEEVVFCHDRATGLRAVVAVHSTALGPALGGTRFHPYPDEDSAVEDVLRLARGMTLKSAAAGLDLGGGKAVIIGDPKELRSEALLRCYGRFVDGLGGRYVTAEDVGTTQADMDLIRRETRHVTGVSPALGGSGDPSAATAFGVAAAMRAAAAHRWGAPELAGRHVVVIGVGKVGSHLVRHLLDEGARVTVADVDTAAVARTRAAAAAAGRPVPEAVDVERAHAVACDVLAPCALGGLLSPTTVPELACEVIVGAANNQLSGPATADLLAARGITYAPDFVCNAGGVINIAEELRGYDRDRAYANVARIADNVTAVLQTAEAAGITTARAAEQVARDRIEALSRVRRIRTFDRSRPT